MGLPAFNFRSLCERCCEAIKLLELFVSDSDSIDREKSRSFLRLQRNYLLKKSVKTTRFCGK